MSKTYIPKGTTERYDSITADTLVVHGRLIVKGIVRAARICGKGFIEAGTVRASSVVIDTLDAERVIARTVIANKIMCVSADVSRGIIARDYIEAVDVKTGRLSASITNIERLRAKEIIDSSPKSSFLWIIFSSWVNERFVQGWHGRVAKKTSKLSASVKSEPKEKNFHETLYDNLCEAYREKFVSGRYRLVLESVDVICDEKKHDAA
jgi:hypothetical protein